MTALVDGSSLTTVLSRRAVNCKIKFDVHAIYSKNTNFNLICNKKPKKKVRLCLSELDFYGDVITQYTLNMIE